MYLLSTGNIGDQADSDRPKVRWTRSCRRSPTTASISHTGVFDSEDEAVLYSLPLQGGEPKMVALFRDFPSGLTWSADDKKLIYSLWNGCSDSTRRSYCREWLGKTTCLRRKRIAAHSFVQGRQACLQLSLLELKDLAQGPASPGISGRRTHPFLAGTIRRSILSGRKAHCLCVSTIWRAGSLDQQ